jgi:acylphosphatase
LNHADEWIFNQWPNYCKSIANGEITQEAAAISKSSSSKPAILGILGRRLIYSHHIISKIKRADMKDLASHYKLTGYIKIGWPGLIIIEGTEEDCQSFYDEIRPWQWQYLVVRGEQQETVPNGKSVDDLRRFPGFHEEDNMAFVAQQCREVGLESLFRTSMKVYDNEQVQPGSEDDESLVSWYGALVHVDHMNNGKAYRKWLRKTSQGTDCFLLIKQCYPNQDFSQRPRILVGIVGDRVSVASFLKRWRTSRVDEDSKGKPCLERMMSVLIEGELEHNAASVLDWDDSMAEEHLNISDQQLTEIVTGIGGDAWSQSLQSAISF